MAAHSSILAWKIPWTVELINKPRDFLPGGHNIYCNAKTKTVANEISFRKVHHLKMTSFLNFLINLFILLHNIALVLPYKMISEVTEAGYDPVFAVFQATFLATSSSNN